MGARWQPRARKPTGLGAGSQGGAGRASSESQALESISKKSLWSSMTVVRVAALRS